jgi:uncharacterized surface protein with fasciclin (FAS1) repeats
MRRLFLMLAATTAIATTASAQTTPAPAAPAAPATAAPATAAPADPAATPNPMVGGVAMDATKPIVANASVAPTLTTLVTAVKAADLVATLSGPGPFTVFAPTNDAFSRLAPGTLDTLMKPANKATLTKVLTYHVVPGTITIEQLKTLAASAAPTLKTVEGEMLTVTASGGAIQLTDVSGNKSYIEIGDVRQSNGVVHVVNGVLVPKL